MKKINFGVIGLGHWGPNFIRTLSRIPNVNVLCVCDLNQKNLAKIKQFNDEIFTTTNAEDVFINNSIDAVIIATPAKEHFNLAKRALEFDKHVLCEKPLTTNIDDAQTLINKAEAKNKILFVDHTFLFNSAILKMKGMIDAGLIGEIYYLTATRTHLGLIREDVNVAWDLAPHDLSVFNYLLGSSPERISGTGASFLRQGREDVAFINLEYPGGIIANIQVSWVDTNKERKIVAVGSKGRLVFDDLNNLERLKLYEKGISVSDQANDFGEFQLNLRDGDIVSPNIKMEEPLRLVCEEFIHCVRSNIKPISDGIFGLEIVKSLCALDHILKNRT